MHHKKGSCIDAGSAHCPCMLAACGECMICSRLAGKKYCDCDWQGVCVYNEFMQNGSLPSKLRGSDWYKIQKKIWYEKDLAVMRIEVPKGFAETASLPGSCVFIRAEGKPAAFDMPVSVMCADHENCTVDIAVKSCGPKSRELLNADKYVEMRGVYRNGLIGTEKIMTARNKRVLCLAKGVGLAPVVNYCRWSAGRDSIDAVVDLEKINRFFAEDCLSSCKLNKLTYDRLPLGDTTGFYGDYDVVMLCASDYYQENISIPEYKRVLSNNFSMCCGEGICGACARVDENGTVFRMCKCKER